MTDSYTLTPIATLTGCYPDKFGVPRQPGLVRHATASVIFLPPFDQRDAVRGLEDFSHIWLTFLFHHNPDKWHPLVRPPRLGGNAKIGVFASRATHRPNRIGLSLVELVSIDTQPTLSLKVRGHDLVDGTPILDIKPYLPWADSISDARAGFAPQRPQRHDVRFSEDAEHYLRTHDEDPATLRHLILEVLAQDPRPAYHSNNGDRRYGVRLKHVDVGFKLDTSSKETCFIVTDIRPMS